MSLIKSSDYIEDQRCPRCRVSFIERPGIRVRVYKNTLYCQSYAACTARLRKTEVQRGNRDRFGKGEGKNPCELLVTGNRKKGEPTLNVRCYCMAVFGAIKYRSLKYDVLGVVDTWAEAKALWQSHVRGLTSINLDDTLNAKEADNDGEAPSR